MEARCYGAPGVRTCLHGERRVGPRSGRFSRGIFSLLHFYRRSLVKWTVCKGSKNAFGRCFVRQSPSLEPLCRLSCAVCRIALSCVVYNFAVRAGLVGPGSFIIGGNFMSIIFDVYGREVLDSAATPRLRSRLPSTTVRSHARSFRLAHLLAHSRLLSCVTAIRTATLARAFRRPSPM